MQRHYPGWSDYISTKDPSLWPVADRAVKDITSLLNTHLGNLPIIRVDPQRKLFDFTDSIVGTLFFWGLEDAGYVREIPPGNHFSQMPVGDFALLYARELYKC